MRNVANLPNQVHLYIDRCSILFLYVPPSEAEEDELEAAEEEPEEKAVEAEGVEVGLMATQVFELRRSLVCSWMFAWSIARRC